MTSRVKLWVNMVRQLLCGNLGLSWYSLAAAHSTDGEESCIYFCGNSLGLQPRRTSERVSSHLAAWAKKGVLGHFTEHEDSTLPPFLHIDDTAARFMAPLVGAKAEEVAVMETLTANLHFLMASFYQPTKERYKIIIEGKAFPSDHVRCPVVGALLIFDLTNVCLVRCGVSDPASWIRS
jgi:kynureninase